jgi:hypothetical protein
MNAYQTHADGIQQVQDYLGDACPVFAWGGQAIRILPGSVKRGKDLELGGFGPYANLEFVVLMKDLPADLGLKQIITYLGGNYRVETIEGFAGQSLARFACVDASQGV